MYHRQHTPNLFLISLPIGKTKFHPWMEEKYPKTPKISTPDPTVFLLSSFHLRTAQEPSKIPQANIYILRYICLLLKELECSTQRLPHKLSTLSSQRTRAYPNAERHAKLTSYDKNVRRQEQKPITSRGIVGEIARGVKS